MVGGGEGDSGGGGGELQCIHIQKVYLLFVFFCFATIEFPKLVRLSIHQHIDIKIINKGAHSSRLGPMLVFLL